MKIKIKTSKGEEISYGSISEFRKQYELSKRPLGNGALCDWIKEQWGNDCIVFLGIVRIL